MLRGDPLHILLHATFSADSCSAWSITARVADSPGEPAGVEALEQELGGTPRDAERVAEAGEGDRRER